MIKNKDDMKSLSEEGYEVNDGYHPVETVYPEYKVKEAVKRLKEKFKKIDSNKLASGDACNYDLIDEIINKIFGDKLT